MSFTTIFLSDAGLPPISPTALDDPDKTTVTCRLSTTLRASQGQTITITSPPSALLPPPITAATTVYSPAVATRTSTITVTELDVFLQNPEDSIYSTRYISLSPTLAPPSSPTNPDVYLVFVVEPEEDGWDGWSTGEKAGLITGVALGAIVIMGVILFLLRRRKIWAVGGWWPFMARRNVPYPGPLAQPGYTAGAMVPYAYGQQQPYYYPGR